jgi:hypothetical protein
MHKPTWRRDARRSAQRKINEWVYNKPNVVHVRRRPSKKNIPKKVIIEQSSSPQVDSVLHDIFEGLTKPEWLQFGGDVGSQEQTEEENDNISVKAEEDHNDNNADSPSRSEENDDVDEDEDDDIITLAMWHTLMTTPLYPNSKMSALQGILLVHQYLIDSNMNKTNSENLLKLLREMLPDNNLLPPSYYKLMKV